MKFAYGCNRPDRNKIKINKNKNHTKEIFNGNLQAKTKAKKNIFERKIHKNE